MSVINTDFRQIFETSPLLILVLSPELKAMAATNAYLAATLTKRDEIMGRLVYDIFPDNPDDPNPTGVANLKASFNRVLQNKVPDAMGTLKYDIPKADGTFESKYWSTMNTPVMDEAGNVLHIINQVVDITDYMVMKEKSEQYKQQAEELSERAQNMESEIYQRAQQLQAANEKLSVTNEELRTMQEELQSTNEEMQAAHEELRVQQEELQDMNERLMQNNEELEQTSTSLMLKTEELERSNGFKTDFLSNMSHELRTPLNSMLILSKLLSNNLGKNLTEKQVEQANIINRAGNDLLKLINDILDLSKIEAGKVEMVMEKTPVALIIESIEGTMSSMAAQKNITFDVKVSEDAGPHLHTDRFRLEQILKNLLSNAFKFTDEGGRVGFTVAKAPDDVKYTHEFLLRKNIDVLMFAISDTGIGIPADKLGDIFDAFKQADGSTSRKYGGTGLGLSISKQLTNLLGGEIQLSSVEGQGSTFYVYLPVSYTPDEERAYELPEVKEEPHDDDEARYVTVLYDSIPLVPEEHMRQLLKGKTILVTDDHERNITALEMILDNYGPKLLRAANGVEALEALKTEHVDIVLLDIMMPQMDGYETIKRIRAQEQFKKLPIIVITAHSLKQALNEGLLNDIAGYMQKPIDMKQLLGMMKAVLAKEQKI